MRTGKVIEDVIAIKGIVLRNRPASDFIGTQEVIDAQGGYILPGLIDTCVCHDDGNYDVMRIIGRIRRLSCVSMALTYEANI